MFIITLASNEEDLTDIQSTRVQLIATQSRSHILNTIVYYIHCVITRSYNTDNTPKVILLNTTVYLYLH